MATCTKNINVTINLSLTEEEAEWLKAYLQNNVNKDETAEEAKIRLELFTLLSANTLPDEGNWISRNEESDF